MPFDNAPSHKPQHGDLTSMKKASSSDALNIAESEAHTFRGRESTVAERERALDINATQKPEFGYLAAHKVLDNHLEIRGGGPPLTKTKTSFTP